MSIPSGTVLRPGDSGNYVRQLQEALVDNNFYPDANASNNGVDGIYGPNTEDAVTRYQIMNGLDVDGIAGPQTLNSLGLTSGSGGGGSSSTLRPGHTGAAVRRLQQALVDNNFYPNISAPNNGVDGIYGANTEDAVRRYQIMNGLTVDGIAGPQTLASLGLSGGDPGSPNSPTLREGDSGENVRLLQQALVDNNFYPNIHAANYGVDGIFGPNTKDAVRRFQIMNGLTVDGIAGPQTLSALGISGGGSGSSGNSGSYRGTLRVGDRGDAVRLLQEALVDNNFYPDRNAPNYGIDGIYGPNTEDAVRRYQIMNGLTVDGIAGPQTLASLGLNGGSGGNDFDPPEGGIDFRGGDYGDISISQLFIPTYNYNRPGYAMRPQYITIHETANTAPGATAFMHANYVRNASTPTSWHFTVDQGGVIYQHLPTNETGFHAGDGSGDGNRNSIGIELCVNSTGDFSKTRRNAAVLVRLLMSQLAIPIQNVVTHNHWSGKNCPRNLLNEFDMFKNQIMDSTIPVYERTSVESPFTNISEGYWDEQKDSGDTVSYSTSYNVKIGPLSGSLDGEIILGDPNNVDWDINDITKRIEKGSLEYWLTDAVNALLQASMLPFFSSVAEAETEVRSILSDEINNTIEARLTGPELTFSLDNNLFFDFKYITLEVLREITNNVYTKEVLSLDKIDWNDYTDKLNPQVVLILVLIAAILFSFGWQVSAVARFLLNPAF
ncbi:peptidoglycan recognition protein family protein [Oceanobacillus kimchii]|uniref:peptidoglycan recognition protein family protein n=1 Tax=Oceanobacillus kimchii TaxID=746691 RepID=UPI0035CCCB8B